MQVAIGIPTTNSHNYIFENLMMYLPHIKELNDHFIVKVFVALNGDENSDLTKEQIRKALVEYDKNSVEIVLLECVNSGKNNALNEILCTCRKSNEIDIIHFLDDDILLSDDTLICNVKTLINGKKKLNQPVLIGTNIYARKRELKHYYSKNKSLIISLKQAFFNYIFSLPFEKSSEAPRFCMGGCLCFYIDDFGLYPSDDTGIADDGYIGNYFLLSAGKNNHPGSKNIIKPPESVAYFEVASSLTEWINQQVRIFTGVYYS